MSALPEPFRDILLSIARSARPLQPDGQSGGLSWEVRA